MQVELKVMNGQGHATVLIEKETIADLERALNAAIPPAALIHDAATGEPIDRAEWDPKEHPDVIVVPAFAGG